MTIPFAKSKSAKRHLFRGQMMTADQIAEATGIKARTVYRRIQFGLPIEGPARFGPAPRQFEFRGRLATMAEIMTETGLSLSQVSKRTDGIRFFEKDELKDPNAPLPEHAHKVFFRGITDSVAGWSRRTGISKFVLHERIVQNGWPLKRALTEPVMSPGQRALYKRNAQMIARMANAFHKTTTTGGQSAIFPKSQSTGGVRSKIHCEGEKPKIWEFGPEASA